MTSDRKDAPQHGARPVILVVAALVGLACLIAVFVASRMTQTPTPNPTPQEPPVAQSITTRTVTETVVAPPAVPPERPIETVAVPSAPVLPVGRPAAQSVSGPAASAESRQWVNNIVHPVLVNGTLTPEQAAAWKLNLQQLVQRGVSAVPAIQEFLSKNTDFDFGAGGPGMLGYSSARAALFDALTQIGGPEAISAMTRVLQVSADPREIALLAQRLEQLEPSQHRQEVVDAARQSLDVLGAQKFQNTDVAPLFEVLQKYGDASVVSDLEQAARQWGYYGTMALGQLPDGAGIPSLIQMLQDPKAGMIIHDGALQMLAEVSAQSADARAALMQQVRANAISSFAWQLLAPVLAGDMVGFVNSGFNDQQPLAPLSGMRTTGTSDNQHFFSMPVELTAAQVEQRNAFIDQLLAATADPAAREALQRAKTLLANRGPQVAATPGP